MHSSLAQGIHNPKASSIGLLPKATTPWVLRAINVSQHGARMERSRYSGPDTGSGGLRALMQYEQVGSWAGHNSVCSPLCIAELDQDNRVSEFFDDSPHLAAR